MNRDDIISMAREAGLHLLQDNESCSNLVDYLERFAALVAAAERERIKAANAPEIEKINAHIKALEDAVAAEREACAKVCDRYVDSPSDQEAGAALNIQDEIRTRGRS